MLERSAHRVHTGGGDGPPPAPNYRLDFAAMYKFAGGNRPNGSPTEQELLKLLGQAMGVASLALVVLLVWLLLGGLRLL